jgi:uncharacterized membrane protein
MVVLLISAGIVHLVSPETFLFLLPEWLPYKYLCIYLSGVLEILLGLGLLSKKLRPKIAILTAFFFAFLEIFHLYVAIEGIPMLGSSNPYFLWGRVMAQFALIYWAWSLRSDQKPSK